MQQYMIALDLDGTALNNDPKMTDLTVRTLRTLDEMGHHVLLVTGRPYRMTKEIYRYLNIDQGLINFNGAYIHHPGKPAWAPTSHSELDREMAFELISKQEELGIDLLLAEGKDQLFSTTRHIPKNPFFTTDIKAVLPLNPSSLTYNPTALSIYCPDDKQEEIADRLRGLYGDYISVRRWGGILPLIEVVRSGINKGSAVQHVADFYHIPREQIIAFGDEDNDLEMLEFAGTGVAMQNAIPEVQAIADQITPLTNEEDGLAHFLIDYFAL